MNIVGWIRTQHLHKVKKKRGSQCDFYEVADDAPAAWEKKINVDAVPAPHAGRMQEEASVAKRPRKGPSFKAAAIAGAPTAKPQIGQLKKHVMKPASSTHSGSKARQAPASTGRTSDPEQSSLFMTSAKGELKSGMVVRLHGLVAAADYNGRLGILKSFDLTKNRWCVTLDSGEEKNLLANNLIVERSPGSKVVTGSSAATPVIVKGVKAAGEGKQKSSESQQGAVYRIHFRCDGKDSTPLRCLGKEDAPHIDVAVKQREMVQLLRTSDDGQWSRVQCAKGVGWIGTSLLQNLPGEGAFDKTVKLSPVRKDMKTVKKEGKLKSKQEADVRRRMTGKSSPSKASEKQSSQDTGKGKEKNKGTKAFLKAAATRKGKGKVKARGK